MTQPTLRSAWRCTLELNSALLRIFERELQADCGISLSWYDVLVHLWEAPGHEMRMNELADALVLSRSWLTRRIDRMEAAGLVHRCPSRQDARGKCAVLTPAGRRMYARAERLHGRSVQNHFLSQLSATETATIAEAFGRLLIAANQVLRGAPRA